MGCVVVPTTLFRNVRVMVEYSACLFTINFFISLTKFAGRLQPFRSNKCASDITCRTVYREYAKHCRCTVLLPACPADAVLSGETSRFGREMN